MVLQPVHHHRSVIGGTPICKTPMGHAVAHPTQPSYTRVANGSRSPRRAHYAARKVVSTGGAWQWFFGICFTWREEEKTSGESRPLVLERPESAEEVSVPHCLPRTPNSELQRAEGNTDGSPQRLLRGVQEADQQGCVGSGMLLHLARGANRDCRTACTHPTAAPAIADRAPSMTAALQGCPTHNARSTWHRALRWRSRLKPLD